MKESQKEFFLQLLRPLFFAGGLLALFIVVAMLVFVLRHRAPQREPMPDLVGNYYFDVHNDLARSRLRIILEHKSYLDLPPGVILSQSIAPGSGIAPRDVVRIAINHPEPLLEMPELTGIPLDTAQSTLRRITHNEMTYQLELGAVSYVTSNSVPAGRIVAQFPLGGSRVTPQQRAFLLVSSGDDQSRVTPAADLSGQHIALAQAWFHERGVDYRLGELRKPERPVERGQLLALSGSESEGFQLDVAWIDGLPPVAGNARRTELRLRGSERCEVYVEPVSDEEWERDMGRRLVFASSAPKAGDERVLLLLYPQSQRAERLIGHCGEREVVNQLI